MDDGLAAVSQRHTTHVPTFVCMTPAENDIPAASYGKTEVFETVLQLAIPSRRALQVSSRWQERVA